MMSARIKLVDMEGLDVLEKSIAPEAATEMPRTNISIERCEVIGENGETSDGLEILIEAEDASSLRAALNSYLRWMNLAMETQDMAKK